MKLYFLVGFVGVFLISCLDDKGSYDYVEINELKISGIDNQYYAEQYVNFKITPTIEGSIEFKPEDYNYTWFLYDDVDRKYLDTLSKEKDLNVTIMVPPNRYNAYFHVEEKTTGVVYAQFFQVDVINLYSRGMIVLSEVDGEANMTFINVVENVVEDVYLNVNGEVAGKNPKKVKFAGNRMLSSAANIIVVTCDDERGSIVLDPLDFSYLMDFTEMFYFPVKRAFVTNFQTRDFGQYEYIINDKDLYEREVMMSGLSFPRFEVRIAGDYELAPFDFNAAATTNIAYYYDQLNRRFLKIFTFMTSSSMILLDDDYSSSFNPNNLEMDMIWGDLANNTDGRAIMENDEGERFLISFTCGPVGIIPGQKFDFNDEGAGEAKTFAISAYTNFLYYAFDNKINCMSISTGDLWKKDVFVAEGMVIDYIECLENNGVKELFIGMSDGSGSKKSGSVVVCSMESDGSLKEKRRYENVCGRVVDFEFKAA